MQIGGTRPRYWLPFHGTMPNEKRIGQIIDSLSLAKERRPQLLTLYFGDVDKAGHRFGPDSPEVDAALRVAVGDGELKFGTGWKSGPDWPLRDRKSENRK